MGRNVDGIHCGAAQAFLNDGQGPFSGRNGIRDVPNGGVGRHRNGKMGSSPPRCADLVCIGLGDIEQLLSVVCTSARNCCNNMDELLRLVLDDMTLRD